MKNLLTLDLENCGNKLNETLGADDRGYNGDVAKSNFETFCTDCDDVELLKELAIHVDGYSFAYCLEDILIEMMGECEYFDFADENELA